MAACVLATRGQGSSERGTRVRSRGARGEAHGGRGRGAPALALQPRQGLLSRDRLHQGPGDRVLHAIAPVLLPHLRGRHLTLKRYPERRRGPVFYEKQCPGHRPDWVRTAGVYSRHNEREIDYCLADDLATIVWLANLADLEMHTPLAPRRRAGAADDAGVRPRPGPPATIVECAEVACRLREVFDHFGLVAFPKTSGSKGMQLYVPLNTPTVVPRDEAVRAGRRAGARAPPSRARRVRDAQGPAARARCSSTGARTTSTRRRCACTRCARASARPSRRRVTWDEVDAAAARRATPTTSSFTRDEVLARVAEHGDAFAPVLELQQELPA